MTIPVDTYGDDHVFYGPIQNITVTGSPFTLKCPDDDSAQPSARLFINGGEVQEIAYLRALWNDPADWVLLGAVPAYIDLRPGDSVRMTYTSAPVMKWCAF